MQGQGRREQRLLTWFPASRNIARKLNHCDEQNFSHLRNSTDGFWYLYKDCLKIYQQAIMTVKWKCFDLHRFIQSICHVVRFCSRNTKVCTFRGYWTAENNASILTGQGITLVINSFSPYLPQAFSCVVYCPQLRSSHKFLVFFHSF